MSDRDSTLSWHRTAKPYDAPGIVYRAWAPALNPGDRMPPYYLIIPVSRNQAVRSVMLKRCKSCIGADDRGDLNLQPSNNLAAAKVDAQRDYEKRISQQS